MPNLSRSSNQNTVISTSNKLVHLVILSLTSFKFKKGDLVVINENGQATVYEIISSLAANKNMKSGTDVCYDAKHVLTGKVTTIYQEEILRLATPVDNSAQLFRRENMGT